MLKLNMGRKKKERLDRQSNEIILFIKGGHGGLVVNAINRLFYQLCFAPTESCIDLYSFHHGVCSICTLHQSLPRYLPTSDGFIQEVQLHLPIKTGAKLLKVM